MKVVKKKEKVEGKKKTFEAKPYNKRVDFVNTRLQWLDYCVSMKFLSYMFDSHSSSIRQREENLGPILKIKWKDGKTGNKGWQVE